MDKFEKLFKDVTISTNSSKVWDEWLDYCIDINLFTLENQHLNFNGREKEYFELFKTWMEIMYDEVRKENTPTNVTGWCDYLGTFYENNVKTSYHASNRGQFFTPPHVCQMMAEVTMALNNNNYKDDFLLDPCCGSGRFILAGHSIEPQVIGYGIDSDPVSCKMAVMNLWISGCRGTIINGNSLSNEFIQGWRVNQYLGYGLPVPHIEKINSYEEGLYYFGRQYRQNKTINEYIDEEKETRNIVQASLDNYIGG